MRPWALLAAGAACAVLLLRVPLAREVALAVVETLATAGLWHALNQPRAR